jgi:hypothetical protein
MGPITHEIRALGRTPGGRTLVASVSAIAALTVIGLLALWPYGWSADDAITPAPVVSAKVLEAVEYDCGGTVCIRLVADVDGARQDVNLGNLRLQTSVHAGDTVRLTDAGGHYEFVPVEAVPHGHGHHH